MKLPPLNALRAFEAAARTGGYAAAAAELRAAGRALRRAMNKLQGDR